MPGKSGFDFSGASQSFNALAEYLFGKVVIHFRTESCSCILELGCFSSLHLLVSPFYFGRSFRCVMLFFMVEYNEGENGDDYTRYYQ
jgi:hypothetical protein